MSAPASRPAYHRPALIALVVVAFAACLALAWWQWERYESAAGTAQNLGYALQWPLFAGFVVFAYYRFVRLEREAEQDTEQPDTGPRSAAPASPAAGEQVAAEGRRRRTRDLPREIPAGILPERPTAARSTDPALAEYNRYLAGLHAADVEEAVRTAPAPSSGSSTGTSERSAG
ncbi:transcriptional regulator [Nocardia shimofusensis]|uniref:transcriptional regulator n=1 Tax=Nocardia shimofusensis TaxID=228596 RepID=UPI0012ED686E